MKPRAAEWVAKAEGDYRAMLTLRRAKRPVHDAICYHAQQSAEKYLKAWLVEQGIAVPKIHDLQALIEVCLPTLPELSVHQSDAIYLTSYAVEIRYPGMSASKLNTQTACNAIRVIRKLMRTRLSL